MTLLKELCVELDKRGVPYWKMGAQAVWFGIEGENHNIEVYKQLDGWLGLDMFDLTPKRVVEATLGRGTCHDKNGFDHTYTHGFECTICGTMTDGYMVTVDDTGHDVQFNYCPNCGAEVVDE